MATGFIHCLLSDSDTDRDNDSRGLLADRQFFNSLLNSDCVLFNGFFGSEAQDRKFIATPTKDVVRFPRGCQQVSQLPEDFITSQVPVAVINLFEVIDIEKQNGQWLEIVSSTTFYKTVTLQN